MNCFNVGLGELVHIYYVGLRVLTSTWGVECTELYVGRETLSHVNVGFEFFSPIYKLKPSNYVILLAIYYYSRDWIDTRIYNTNS